MRPIRFFYCPDGDEAAVGADATKTDNSGLKTNHGDAVYVSPDGGTTNEAFPVPGVEYDFCIAVGNTGQLKSDKFIVRFTLDNGSGVQTFDFDMDDGLDAGQQVLATVHYEGFPDDDKEYTLGACIISPSAPDSPLDCAGTFGFNPHLNKH